MGLVHWVEKKDIHQQDPGKGYKMIPDKETHHKRCILY